MWRRWFVLAVVGLGMGGLVPVALRPAQGDETQPVTMTLEHAETAGICGFRMLWDTPVVLDEKGATEIKDAKVKDSGATAVWAPSKRPNKQPGALAFDALQRALLVRFPRAAEEIASRLDKGHALVKVELVLPYLDTEIWPPGDPAWPTPDGYTYRTNFGVDELYRSRPPQWHAVAWALRRPWTADHEIGPTFNAFIHGTGYWSTYGARDETRDRYPQRFGPTEVSYKSPEGRMDVTPVLTDEAFGKTPEERLRALAGQGFLVQKWETYDHRYYKQVYEWATGTGGRAIRIKAPKLVVTLKPVASAPPVGTLPPATDVRRTAAELRRTSGGGKPTAVMPTREQLIGWIETSNRKPEWMPDWQWDHVQQLTSLGTERHAPEPFWYQFVPENMAELKLRRRVNKQGTWVMEPALPDDVYAAWVDTLIGRQPRGWYGFEAAKEMMQWYVYRDKLPGPARDSIVTNWTAWLLPDRPTSELVHPMVDQSAGKPVTSLEFVDTYYAQTGDWRGNKSFYRDGFNYSISTQNFNVTASTGALLGGSIIDSKYAMTDGRHGVESFPLRLWAYSKGASQEAIDHYYFAVTLSGQKAVADFGPTTLDRLMGQSMLARSVEELTSAYHPGLRRFISGSSRTAPNYLLVTQDGLQHIVHTLSRSGALHDLDRPELPGNMPLLGHEVPPTRVAQQTRPGPWAPEWVSHMVDDKPLPYEVTARGNDVWARAYLGANYGLASRSRSDARIQVMAQWRRQPKPVERLQDLVTLDMRYGINTTRWNNDQPGWVAPIGHQAVLQQKNKMIVLASPWNADFLRQAAAKEGLGSLQSSMALFNYQQPKPSWEIYVDGRHIDKLPVQARQGQRITIRDGATYLGVIALPATDLGRNAEVMLEEGDEQEFQKIKIHPALVIHSYNLRTAKPSSGAKPPEPAKLEAFEKAHAGFFVELGDEKEHGDFAAFQKHFEGVKVALDEQAAKSTVQVRCTSGPDILEAVARLTPRTGDNRMLGFVQCRVNGKDPYLPDDLDRDTTLTQQGRRNRLEKNGAVLRTGAGRTAYLQTEPVSGTYAGFNPLPDLTRWALEVPGGVAVRADGSLGLARVIVRPKENRLWIDHALKEEQQGPELARVLFVTGLSGQPIVERNGRKVDKGITPATAGGQAGFVIPLTEEMPDTVVKKVLEELPERLKTNAP